ANVRNRAGQDCGPGAPNSTAFAEAKMAMSKRSSVAWMRSSRVRSGGGRITVAGNTMGDAPSAANCAARPAACRAGRVTRTPTSCNGPRRGGSDECTLIGKYLGATRWCRSRRQETGSAARQEVVGEIAAELYRSLGIRNVRVHFPAHDIVALAIGDEPAQPQRTFLPFGIRGERQLTTAAKRARERALR